MELDKYIELIKYLINQHAIMSAKWDEYCLYNGIMQFNQKKTQIIDITSDPKLMESINSYWNYLNDNSGDYTIYLDKNDIRYRIKTANSINSKIAKYINSNSEKGRVPVAKCLNDIFGARIITNEYFDYNTIFEFISKHFPDLKCVASIKNGYNATHIYFKTDNYHFQWELQIWSKKYEEANLSSHIKHKEAYAKWENEFIPTQEGQL